MTEPLDTPAPEPVSDPLLDILNALPAPEGLFEVHYWPHTGRVMTVHLDDDAQVTDLRLVGTAGGAHLADLTAALAEHLADNSNPRGDALVEHAADGTVTYLWDQPAAADAHPAHTECADGCGLAVTHTGACLDKPGGRPVCHHDDAAEDLTFRLLATGITLPGPALTARNVGPLADGGRRGTLVRDGIAIGAILQPAGERPTFQASEPARRDQLTADLADFARSCRDADGLPVTLSVLLDALLTEYAAPATRPATPRRPR